MPVLMLRRMLTLGASRWLAGTGLAALACGAAAQEPAASASVAATAPTPPVLDAFAAAAAKEPGAIVRPSGLVFRSLKEGTGRNPRATDTVVVHYRGILASGKEFDSSYKRGHVVEFPLSRVIPCWTEGVQLMKAGGKARLTCPAAIAYGARGAGNGLIPPNATLQFEVEVQEIIF